MNTAAIESVAKKIFFFLVGSPWVLVIAFAVLRSQGHEPAFDSGVEGLPLLSTIAIFVAVGGAIASRFATPLMLKKAAAESPRRPTASVMLQIQIIAQALCEAGGLFGALAWHLEGNPVALAAPFVCTVAALRFWPGEARRREIERALDPLAGPGAR